MGKFLDISEDLEELKKSKKIGKIFDKINKKRLTPLEFTILESILQNNGISRSYLIEILNEKFAGTWKAKSGSIYPKISKLKARGYLEDKKVKSPIGPLTTIYTITKAGREIVKTKINKNFDNQITFIHNFLIELSSIYIKSFPIKEQDQVLQNIIFKLKNKFRDIIEKIPKTLKPMKTCPECGLKFPIDEDINFCPECATPATQFIKRGVIQLEENKENNK